MNSNNKELSQPKLYNLELINFKFKIMKQKLIIIGASTTAIHVYKFINEYELFDIVGFAVNRQYINEEIFMGLPLYSIEDLEDIIDKNEDLLFVAMLWNKLNADRRHIYENLKKEGYHFANIISPTAKIRGKLKGDNCWIHDYAIIQNDVEIGENVAMMAFTLIGAHTEIGSHCFFGAKSTIGGGCKIGKQSFIGINSTVFDDTIIGEKCIVGACTAVKRNMPDYSLCKTSSTNTEIKQYSEDIIESKLLFSKNVR